MDYLSYKTFVWPQNPHTYVEKTSRGAPGGGPDMDAVLHVQVLAGDLGQRNLRDR